MNKILKIRFFSYFSIKTVHNFIFSNSSYTLRLLLVNLKVLDIKQARTFLNLKSYKIYLVTRIFPLNPIIFCHFYTAFIFYALSISDSINFYSCIQCACPKKNFPLLTTKFFTVYEESLSSINRVLLQKHYAQRPLIVMDVRKVFHQSAVLLGGISGFIPPRWCMDHVDRNCHLRGIFSQWLLPNQPYKNKYTCNEKLLNIKVRRNSVLISSQIIYRFICFNMCLVSIVGMLDCGTDYYYSKELLLIFFVDLKVTIAHHKIQFIDIWK